MDRAYCAHDLDPGRAPARVAFATYAQAWRPDALPSTARGYRSQARHGLLTAIESEVIAGTGADEHMTGLLNTSGVLTQAFATDVPTTLRKARTTLEISGEAPTAYVLHPTDVEAIDLQRAGAAGAPRGRG